MRANEIDHNVIPNKPHLIYRIRCFSVWCDFVDVNNFHIHTQQNIQTHLDDSFELQSHAEKKNSIQFHADHMKYFHTVYILECALCRTNAISEKKNPEPNHEYTKHRCTERIVITVCQSTSCA